MEEFPEPAYSPEKIERIRREFLKLFQALSPADQRVVMEMRMQQGIDLLSRYGDAKQYALFHALIGSSIDESIQPITAEDFPGGDSIELFLDRLKEEFLS